MPPWPDPATDLPLLSGPLSLGDGCLISDMPDDLKGVYTTLLESLQYLYLERDEQDDTIVSRLRGQFYEKAFSITYRAAVYLEWETLTRARQEVKLA